MNAVKQFFFYLTLGPLRTKRESAKRRERYEFLKEQIKVRHFGGYAGLIVNFPGRKFDVKDMGCFKAPMYFIVKNEDGFYCIFWDRSRLTREIGTGAPLKEGEMLIPDNKLRTKPDSTLETIDEQKPLTVAVEVPVTDQSVAGMIANTADHAPEADSRGTGDSSL